MKKVAIIFTLLVAIIASGAVVDAKSHTNSKVRTSSSKSKSKSTSTSGLSFTISNQSKADDGNYSALYSYAEGNLEGLLEKDVYNFIDFWRFPTDEDEFTGEVQIILSLPESFPTDAVQNAVLKKANESVESLFSFLEEDIYNKVITSTDYIYNSPEAFIQKWEKIFNILSKEYSTPRDEDFDMGGFLTFVCNQIYEDSNYVSYVFFLDLGLFRLEGNDGYYWDYVTYEKSTGKILKYSDINFTNGKDVLKQKLQVAYKAEARAKDVTPERISGNTLLKDFTSIALVEDGILFHYPIYVLGVGSEWQYNLFIPGKLSGK